MIKVILKISKIGKICHQEDDFYVTDNKWCGWSLSAVSSFSIYILYYVTFPFERYREGGWGDTDNKEVSEPRRIAQKNKQF